MGNSAYLENGTSISHNAWLLKYISILILIIAFCLLFHPKILNIRIPFGKKYESVHLHYVNDFFLWTRKTNNQAERIIVGEKDFLRNTYFRSRQTYIIIHGFLCSGLDEWVISMKDALLKRIDSNVISVNWEAGSMTIGYYVIQERVPFVGSDVAALVDYIQEIGQLRDSNVHIIGHSLGAHIAGFAGKALRGRIGQITGLDPAGVGFSSLSANGRLDKSDAMFVEIIHTHGCYTILNHWTDCYGTHENIGDADFWPNGGERQSACEVGGDGEEKVREGSNCHHGMAYVFYTESIGYYPTSTHYAARICASWELYNNNSCPCRELTQYMGFNVNHRLSGVFYLNMSCTTPYGKLDPECSPGEYSILRVLGVFMCFLVTIWGIFLLFLQFTSSQNRESFRFLQLI